MRVYHGGNIEEEKEELERIREAPREEEESDKKIKKK